MQAVDLFWITSRHDDDDFDRALEKLEKDLHDVLTGAVFPEELMLKRRSRDSDRPARAVPNQVTLDNTVSSSHTVVGVVTRDRASLLFTLSGVFHTLSLIIGVAKINTEGTRAIDVFYFTELDGTKVESAARITQVRQALLAELHPNPPRCIPPPPFDTPSRKLNPTREIRLLSKVGCGPRPRTLGPRALHR